MKGIAFKNVIYVCSSDRRVEQIGNVLTNADYEILLSGTSDDNYYIGETRKTASLTYNPSTNQLKINGTAVLTQHQDISGKVNKSGDTLSGNLYRQNTGVTLNTTANNSVSETTYATYSFSDSNNTKIAQLVTGAYTSGVIKTYMEVFNKKTDGTDVYGQFGIQANKDGTVTYSVGSPANFRSAINAVNKAGDVITGQLDAKNSNVTIGTTSNNGVTSSTYQGYRVVDKNGTVMSHFLTGAYTNGDVKTYLQTYNTKTNGTRVDNMLSVGVRKNGSLFYEVSSPSAFRDALQLGNMALQDGAHFTQLSVAAFSFKASTTNVTVNATASKPGWTFVCWIACYSIGHTLAGDCYFEYPQNATTRIWSTGARFTANTTVINGLALFMQAGGLEIIA